jgi:glycerol-3-phosphate cytidylyltransferase
MMPNHHWLGRRPSDQTFVENTRWRASMPEGTTGYLFGVFDLFHIAHLDVVRLAADGCDRLIVGVATDELVEEICGVRPYVPFIERIEILDALRLIAGVRPLAELDLTAETVRVGADLVFLPTDELDDVLLAAEVSGRTAWAGLRLVHLPSTRQTASSAVRNALGETKNRRSVA